MQSLTIKGQGDGSVLPAQRMLRVRFKELPPETQVRVYKNGVEMQTRKIYTDEASAEFIFDTSAEYLVTAAVKAQTETEKILERALKVLIPAEGEIEEKQSLFRALRETKTVEQYVSVVDNCPLSQGVKLRLKETL